MMMGFISPIDAVYVSPAVVTFTAKGEKKTIPLDQVIKMREHDWFSKGIALSEECNRHIVQASIKQLTDVRRHGTPRQIIASACSIRHAVQIKALYHEYGLEAEVLHSKLRPEERKRVEAALRQGLADAVVQVQMLGEGYDLPTLSVAAVFRPYRSLSPYIQFVGRILRLANPQAQASLANKVYVVSHLGLNDERWWNDFRNFDKEDQELFRECLDSSPVSIDPSDATPRLSLRPFMRVLDETVDKYLQQAYLKKVDENMVADFMATIREKGYDPSEFGLTEDMVKRRLDAAAAQAREVQPLELPVQPQRRREALRTNIYQDARSIASTVIDRLGLKHAGADLLPHYPGRGSNNLAILITLALRSQNETMGIEAKERDSASIEQLGLAHDATANSADSLTSALRMKMGGKGNVT
jgi:superfamily II DNA or RNA helicase